MSLYVLSVVLFLSWSECRSILDNNDTAIEHLNNCQCIHEEQCYNGIMNTRGVGIISLRNDEDIPFQTPRIQCSKAHFICCKSDAPNQLGIRNDLTLLVLNPVQTTLPDDVDANENHTETSKSGDTCGTQNPSFDVRIRADPDDNSAAIDGEFPWMVSIHKRKRAGGSFEFKCAGTLISDRSVLTAAHCFHGSRNKMKDFKVLANSKKELRSIGSNSINEREIEKIIVHPEFYAGGGHNDIAILILHNSYNESHELNNVCVPNLVSVYDPTKCLATGWGAKRGVTADEIILRKVQLPLINSRNCENMLRNSRLGEDFQLHESFLCAGGEENRDTCKGDGGGPLMCPNEDGRYYQIGIVSWGVNCAEKHMPGVYTNVSKFTDWIEKNSK